MCVLGAVGRGCCLSRNNIRHAGLFPCWFQSWPWLDVFQDPTADQNHSCCCTYVWARSVTFMHSVRARIGKAYPIKLFGRILIRSSSVTNIHRTPQHWFIDSESLLAQRCFHADWITGMQQPIKLNCSILIGMSEQLLLLILESQRGVVVRVLD